MSVEIEKVSRVRLIGRAVRAVAVDSILGSANYMTEGKLQSQVKISRHDDGRCVLTFDYGTHSEAIAHANSLRKRLVLQNLWDFSRSTGVPFDLIADARPADNPE